MVEASEMTDEKKQWSWSRCSIYGCIGCGLIAIISIVIVVVGGVIWLINIPEGGGVRLTNEMEQYALDYLETHQILETNEEVLAYYDVTVQLTGEEAVILTNKRLIYHKEGVTTDIYLENIEDIQHHYESITGDIIVVMSDTGEAMKIAIAPLNDGNVFYDVLLNAWKTTQK